MTDAYQALASLRTMLTARREDMKEKLASGLSVDENYHQHVGRCKELKHLIERISTQIKSLTGDIDETPVRSQ